MISPGECCRYAWKNCYFSALGWIFPYVLVRSSGDKLPQLLFAWERLYFPFLPFFLHFFFSYSPSLLKTALPSILGWQLFTFYIWTYHSVLFWLARFLLRNLLIVSWLLPCMWWVFLFSCCFQNSGSEEGKWRVVQLVWSFSYAGWISSRDLLDSIELIMDNTVYALESLWRD